MRSSAPIPYDVQTMLVDASGKLFWYWREYERFLVKAGVKAAAAKRLTESRTNKYDVMRKLLEKLDASGDGGRRVQLQLVTMIVSAPPETFSGVDAGEAKLIQSRLRKVAQAHGLLPGSEDEQKRAEENVSARQRRAQAQERAAEREHKAVAHAALFAEFCVLLSDTTDTQARGYRLEEMLGEVAELDGLRWVPPFRKSTVVHTDGMLTFEGFQYLVEARWREEPANVAAIATLCNKADRSLHATRGLFVSMAGFRDEVVDEMERRTKKVLLMSGPEVALILEGRCTLVRAMQLKVEEAAKRGRIFFDITKQVIL